MIFNIPVGLAVLVLVSALIYMGVAYRVLDRMKLTDKTAIGLVVLMLAGIWLPEVPLGPVSLDLGGALIPLSIAAYLIATADERREKTRAIVATLMVAFAVVFLDKVLPLDRETLKLDLDPVYMPAFIAAIVAYLAGRSRRSAFIAATAGVVLSDVVAAIENISRGLTQARIAIGGAGVFDAVVLAGIIAVVLAELFGETLEFVHRRGKRKQAKASGPAKHQAPVGLLVLALTVGLFSVLRGAFFMPFADGLDECRRGHYTMLDPDGNVLLETSRRMYNGDMFIAADNRTWVVYRVKGMTALAREAGTDAAVPDLIFGQTVVDRIFRLRPPDEREPELNTPDFPTIGVYHTHNAESYVTSDGTASIYGAGGIHQVGGTFADALKDKGFTVVHDETLHLPHDRGAYRRSRRTAVSLIQNDSPAAIFDIHRDAVPQPVYAEKVGDIWVTQVLIVLGRQNPNMPVNRRFARELKSIADEIHPGLVRGIFLARGNYNQDLFPRALLMEVGSHTNARESAERGITLFADVVEEFFRRRQD